MPSPRFIFRRCVRALAFGFTVVTVSVLGASFTDTARANLPVGIESFGFCCTPGIPSGGNPSPSGSCVRNNSPAEAASCSGYTYSQSAECAAAAAAPRNCQPAQEVGYCCIPSEFKATQQCSFRTGVNTLQSCFSPAVGGKVFDVSKDYCDTACGKIVGFASSSSAPGVYCCARNTPKQGIGQCGEKPVSAEDCPGPVLVPYSTLDQCNQAAQQNCSSRVPPRPVPLVQSCCNQDGKLLVLQSNISLPYSIQNISNATVVTQQQMAQCLAGNGVRSQWYNVAPAQSDIQVRALLCSRTIEGGTNVPTNPIGGESPIGVIIPFPDTPILVCDRRLVRSEVSARVPLCYNYNVIQHGNRTRELTFFNIPPYVNRSNVDNSCPDTCQKLKTIVACAAKYPGETSYSCKPVDADRCTTNGYSFLYTENGTSPTCGAFVTLINGLSGGSQQ